MAAGVSTVTETAEREVAIERVFDAPRRLVFKAWTERRHLVHWSAPRGFTVTHCEGELRPGGAWRCSMRSPEGVDYRLGGIYREIVEPERLVFTHGWEGEQDGLGHATLVTVTFAEHGDKTKVTFRQAGFEQAAARDPRRESREKCLDRFAG